MGGTPCKRHFPPSGFCLRVTNLVLVDFVDESRKTAATARHRAVLKEKRRSSVPQLGSPANGQKRDRHEPLPSDTLVPPSQPNVICHPHNIQVPSSPPSHRTTDSSSSFRISPSSWPLQTSQEAYLTRHFVDHVSCFVSTCSPTFRNESAAHFHIGTVRLLRPRSPFRKRSPTAS